MPPLITFQPLLPPFLRLPPPLPLIFVFANIDDIDIAVRFLRHFHADAGYFH